MTLASANRYVLTDANGQRDVSLGVEHGKNLLDPNATRPFSFGRGGTPSFEWYSV